MLSVIGSPASPYSQKLLAALRYRRISYRLIAPGSPGAAALPPPRVSLLPTVYWSGDAVIEAVTDSTPILQRLECERLERPITPTHPGLRFLNELIEDYADEWLTKPMFHYRWSYRIDAAKAGKVIVGLSNPSLDEGEWASAADLFSNRQIGRLEVVGSNAITAVTIEDSYKRFLVIFDGILRQRVFLFGANPSTSDFAIFGQLSQLCSFDPTPAALALKLAPRVCSWTLATEDLSGLPAAESDQTVDDVIHALEPLLSEIGRTYVPVMLANASALENAASEVHCRIDGVSWIQQPSPYQKKALGWLQASYAHLDDGVRLQMTRAFRTSGLSALFE